MDTATIVNIILSIASTLTAIISVILVVIAIRQNNRMLESSTRPYISIYFDYSQMGEPIGYLVIRNFGNSSGKITSISYNDIVKKQPTNLCNVTAILDGLVGNPVAPNQKFLIPIKLTDSPAGICTFDIAYCSPTKTYEEHFRNKC